MAAFTLTYTVVGAATNIQIDADAMGPPIFARGTSPTGVGGTTVDAGIYHFYAPNDSGHTPNVVFFSEWRIVISVPIVTTSLCLTLANPTLHLCPPVADPQSVSTFKNEPVNITLTGTDPNGESLVFSVSVSPTHGVLTGTEPNLVYTPGAGYTGSDSFQFIATNTDGIVSDLATVDITVAARPAPVQTVSTPASGSSAGNTPITVTGTGFYGAPTITIGGVAATFVELVSDTELTCRTPAGSLGAAAIVVTNPDGQMCTASLDYTYTAPTSAWLMHGFEMKARPEQTS
jgi:IPT/TIG domain/Bacterial Ig domain